VYSTGPWGSGYLGFAIANEMGEEWESRGSQITVTSPPQPVILSTAPHNEHFLNPPGCAVGCFHAGASFTTPAYVSGDVARSVTLVYSSALAAPKGLVELDATNNSSTPAQKISIRLRRPNGAWLTDEVFYTLGFGTSRLAAQFDASGYDTQLLEVEAEVRSYFIGSDTASRTTVRVPILNTQSAVGAGWRIHGMQRLTVTPYAAVLIDEGDGSLIRFNNNSNCVSQCTFTSNIEFTKVTQSSTSGDSVPWVRHYPDSSRVYFHADGRMSYTVDRAGNVTRLGYSFSGGTRRLDSLVDPYGKAISFAYNDGGRIVYITDPGGRRVTLSHNWNDWTLYEIYDPTFNWDWENATAKRLARFEYDASKRLRVRTDSRGNAWTFGYDFAGRLKADSAPAIAVYGGGMQRAVVQYAAPISQVLVNTASGLGTFSNPAPRVDAAQLIATVTDPGGHATTIKVDHYGLPLRITEPLGLVTTITRGYRQRPIYIEYPDGNWRRFGYDEGGYGGNPDVVSSPSGSTSFRYGAKGQVDSIWSTSRPPQRFFLSSLNARVDSVRVGGIDSLKTRYYYPSSAAVRPDSVRDSKGHTTKLHYDAVTGNVDSVVAAAGRYTRTEFDSFGRVTATWTNEGIRRYTHYDILNRVVKAFLGSSLSDTVRYEYDGTLLKRLQDANENVYRFEYNALGWLTKQFDADTANGYVNHSYDVDGMLRSLTNRREQTVHMTYDERHRVRTRSGSGADSTSYDYNALGTVSIGWNSISRDEVYSSFGWTDSVVTTIAGARFHRHYLRGPGADLDSVALTSSTSLQLLARKFIYTPRTQQLQATRTGQFETRYVYNADGQSYSRELPNGIVRTLTLTTNHQVGSVAYSSGASSFDNELWRGYDYDDRGRISRLLRTNHLGSTIGKSVKYDEIGRLNQLVEDGSVVCYPDAEGEQSCSVGLGIVTHAFQYDSAGNRRDGNGQYAPGNRLTSMQGRAGRHFAFTSDLDGNITRKYRVDDPLDVDRRYDWTADGLLRQVWIRHRGTPDDSLQYSYNAFGKLVRRSRRGVVDRYYIWNGDNLWLELNDTLGRIAEYGYEGIDRPSTLITTTAEGGLLVRYIERDELSNVIAVTSGASIAQRVTYDPWGWPENIEGLADTSRLLWKGLLWQADSAHLYYMRNRWYDPETGRFLSEDPIGGFSNKNRYAFGGGDPIGTRDPLGLSYSFNQCPIYWSLSECQGGSEEEITESCPEVPISPEGANLDLNIRRMEGAKFVSGALDAITGGFPGATTLATWGMFYGLVKTDGSWDYKQYGNEYRAFGNFNYGATGAALGFDDETLLNMSAYIDRRENFPEYLDEELMGRRGAVRAFMGIDTYSPLDDNEWGDQEMIERGIGYYRNGCGKR